MRRHRLLSAAITAVFMAAVSLAQQTGHPGQGSGLSLTPLFAFQGYGDSYIRGRGAFIPGVGGGFSQLAKTIPSVPYTNSGVDGLNSDSINFNVWTIAQPSPQQPSAYLLDGGANDITNCGTSAACLANFKEEVNSSISYLAIPNQERVFGSACTQTSGTWTADTTAYPIPTPNYFLNPGTAVSASGSGAILTCTVPSRVASAKVGLNFQVTNAQTGTFTVAVDGVAQTDSCSGTTTFTSAPCGANLLTLPTTIFRQEFTGTPGTSHTVVITTTNAAKVDVTAVDAITAAPQVNSSYVVALGTNAAFDASGIYNTAFQTVANQFATDGARVVFANQQSSTPGPGVNNTTDTSVTATANCDASQSGAHPNDVCGHFHLAQTVVNATKAAGWNIFGTPRPFNAGSAPADLVAFFSTTNLNALSNASVNITPFGDAIAVTRVEWTLGSLSVGCTTFPVLSLKVNGVATTTVTLSSTNTKFNDRADLAIPLNVPQDAALTYSITTLATGCTTAPGNANITIHYKMQ